MSITMTIPDAPTITAIATLIAAVATGVVSILNAIFQRRNNRNLRDKVEEVHTDAKQAVTNTNGQLSTAHAENKALVETNRLLQEQITKMTPRPSRSTDPVPLVPGPVAVEPDRP